MFKISLIFPYFLLMTTEKRGITLPEEMIGIGVFPGVLGCFLIHGVKTGKGGKNIKVSTA